MENSILAYNGIEIYKSDIDIVCDEYISGLEMPDLIYTKTPVFMGLLDRIYKTVLKPVLQSDNSFYNDYELLDKIFDNVYLPICYKYNKTPTINMFCTLAHIDSKNISDIKDGVYRKDGTKVNINSQHIIKRWYNVVESALMGNTFDSNSVGSLFGLKALFGYSDTSNVVITSQIESNQDPQAIAEKYKSVSLPDKPDI